MMGEQILRKDDSEIGTDVLKIVMFMYLKWSKSQNQEVDKCTENEKNLIFV